MIRHRYGVALAWLAASAAARAEPAALTRAADPSQKIPPITYQSPFGGYRGFQVEPREGWPAVNDRAREVGGQAGALVDEEPASRPSPPTASPTPDGDPADHHR